MPQAPSADSLVGRRDAPLVWHRLVESGAAATCAPAVAAALRNAAAVRTVEADVVNRELAHVLDTVRSAGIDLVVMKGAAIAHTHYPKPHLRPRGDSDLLVRAIDRERVEAVLRSCGYAPAEGVDGSLVTRQRQWTRTLGRDLAHAVDLHWELFNPHAFAGVSTAEELFERSVPVDTLAASARAPHPVHGLLLACVHRVAHHAGNDDLLWLYDIRLLAESLPDIDAAEFLTLATNRRVAAICAESLRAAERGVGASLPAPIGAWLERMPWRDTREPTARFLNPPRQVDQLLSDLRALPGLRTRARLVAQHLFPGADYMLRRYGATRRLLLPYLYVRRVIAGMPRWFRR